MSAIEIHQDLRALLGPVREQKLRPTCLAFAASDVHAALRGSWLPLSPEYLFYHSQRRWGQPFTKGASPRFLLEALAKDGQPVEADWQYLSELPDDLDQYGPPAGANVFRRAGEQSKRTFGEIVELLDFGRLPIVMMMLSNAFYTPADGVVAAPSKEAPDPKRRHAMIAVAHGSIDGERAILVRNSWGPGWGLGGHGWLKESYIAPRLMRVAILLEEVNVPGSNLAS